MTETVGTRGKQHQLRLNAAASQMNLLLPNEYHLPAESPSQQPRNSAEHEANDQTGDDRKIEAEILFLDDDVAG
jgi:hypothetical protein